MMQQYMTWRKNIRKYKKLVTEIFVILNRKFKVTLEDSTKLVEFSFLHKF